MHRLIVRPLPTAGDRANCQVRDFYLSGPAPQPPLWHQSTCAGWEPHCGYVCPDPSRWNTALRGTGSRKHQYVDPRVTQHPHPGSCPHCQTKPGKHGQSRTAHRHSWPPGPARIPSRRESALVPVRSYGTWSGIRQTR